MWESKQVGTRNCLDEIMGGTLICITTVLLFVSRKHGYLICCTICIDWVGHKFSYYPHQLSCIFWKIELSVHWHCYFECLSLSIILIYSKSLFYLCNAPDIWITVSAPWVISINPFFLVDHFFILWCSIKQRGYESIR